MKTSLHVAVVTETYPPEVNGVAMTIGRMVNGLLARGHRVSLTRPRQAHDDDGNTSRGVMTDREARAAGHGAAAAPWRGPVRIERAAAALRALPAMARLLSSLVAAQAGSFGGPTRAPPPPPPHWGWAVAAGDCNAPHTPSPA